MTLASSWPATDIDIDIRRLYLAIKIMRLSYLTYSVKLKLSEFGLIA